MCTIDCSAHVVLRGAARGGFYPKFTAGEASKRYYSLGVVAVPKVSEFVEVVATS